MCRDVGFEPLFVVVDRLVSELGVARTAAVGEDEATMRAEAQAGRCETDRAYAASPMGQGPPTAISNRKGPATEAAGQVRVWDENEPVTADGKRVPSVVTPDRLRLPCRPLGGAEA